jgi:hypothetical protein
MVTVTLLCDDDEPIECEWSFADETAVVDELCRLCDEAEKRFWDAINADLVIKEGCARARQRRTEAQNVGGR